ncbi:MAG: carboxypeptidase-like regulatory domain-containing protein, partial [Bacteroidota bacterium]
MKKLSVFLILISLTIFFIFSCQKDKTYNAGESNNLKTTIAGIVLDESNAPLNGATVSAYGQTATTNQYGTFVLKNLFVNKDRCVLQFSKTGFFNRAQGFIASSNTVNYVRIILVSNASSQNFSAAAGGIISLTDGSSVDFQPNSFVTSNGSAYMGTVNIAIKHLSPDDANFGFMIPGGDLLGKDLDNKDVALYTYGMLGVELTGSSGE